jgi:hypothetical protein
MSDTIQEMFQKNFQKRKLGREFDRVFGVALANYFDNFTGFDVIGFDDEVVKSGDGCMADVVREKYGQRALDMIEELLA